MTAGHPDAGLDAPLDAGDVAVFVDGVQSALAGTGEAHVPCGTCNACCRSSMFITIGSEETDTIAHIPRELLFPQPGAAKGRMLLGYTDDGRCPMLVDDACSIYEHRPRACRTFDCRVFVATGVDMDDEVTRPDVTRQSRRWVFHPTSDASTAQLDALRASARFLQARPEWAAPGNQWSPMRLAVRAIEVHDVFLDRTVDPPVIVEPTPEAVQVELRRRR